jgi:hypothetical protein
MRAKDFLTEQRWYRGISDSEAQLISQGKLPKASSVPVPYDVEAVKHLGLSDAEAENLQQELEGKQVINVTRDEDNARGYGDKVLWVDDSLVDIDLSPYGVVDLSSLKNSNKWGIV